MPTNLNDSVSAKHDLDYELVKSIDDEITADSIAIAGYDSSLEGLALSTGLSVKKLATQFAKTLGRKQPIMGGQSDVARAFGPEVQTLIDKLHKLVDKTKTAEERALHKTLHDQVDNNGTRKFLGYEGDF